MTKTTFPATLVLLAGMFLIACNNTETKIESIKPTFSLADAKKEIDEVNKKFMDFVAKGDSAGIASLYTTDAKLMFTGAPATMGQAGIQSVFGGIIKSGVTKVDLKTVDVFGTEELLAEEGSVTIYVKEAAVGEEKYIVLWKKEDGKWKLFRDIANSNSAK
jgi:uncharacterized protein (TIGR02246 family)